MSPKAEMSRGIRKWIIATVTVIVIVAVTLGAVALYKELTKKSDAVLAFEKTVDEVVQECEDFREVVDSMTPSILDVNTMTSFTGKTLGELQAAIDEQQADIDTILRTAAEENRAPHADELGQINAYDSDIIWMNKVKVSLYQEVELDKLLEILLKEGNLTAVQIEQFNIDIQEAFKQANQAAAGAYVAQLARINAIYTAMGKVGSAVYQEARQAAKTTYDEQLARNQDYCGDAMTSLTTSAFILVGVEPAKE